MEQFENCLLYNTRKLDQELTKLAINEFKHLNLHPTYAYILTYIHKNEYVLTKQIVNTLNLSSSTITRMIDKLIDQGYVIRGSDKSTCVIYLTSHGINLIPEINIAWENFHRKYSTNFEQDQIIKLNDNITEMLATLQK